MAVTVTNYREQRDSRLRTQPERRLLFILGFPRSGTKLLRSMLNKHPSIFITTELLFLPYLLSNWHRYGDLSQFANFRRMHADITSTFYFTVRENWGMHVIDAEEWHAACERFDPAGILIPLLRHETGAPVDDKVWLGDKSPNYTTHFDQIKQALPEAKSILIIRDVRDAALSARKLWRSNIYRYAQRWADGMRPFCERLEAPSAHNHLELRYEDLLSEPAASMSRITDFLGLEYRHDMIALDKPSENFGDAKATLGILSGNVQKYKSQLTINEQKGIESICSEVLRHYGYDVLTRESDRRLSSVRMAWYMFKDVSNRILFDLRLGRSPAFVARSLISRTRTRL